MMEAPAQDKAGAGPAQKNTQNPENSPTARPQQYRAGTRATGTFLGDALRHTRRAVELNLRHGPSPAVAQSARQARDALDGALWGCEYGAAEGER